MTISDESARGRLTREAIAAESVSTMILVKYIERSRYKESLEMIPTRRLLSRPGRAKRDRDSPGRPASLPDFGAN